MNMEIILNMCMLCLTQGVQVIANPKYNPMFHNGILTFAVSSERSLYEIPDMVRLEGRAPASQITVLPPPRHPLYGLIPRNLNFTVDLTHGEQFDMCYFLNLVQPQVVPDFEVRLKRPGSVSIYGGAPTVVNRFHRQMRGLFDSESGIFSQQREDIFKNLYERKPLEQRCVRASPQSFEGGQHIYGVNAEVEILRDTPAWTPEPLLDITILTSANIQNITEQVSRMMKSLEAKHMFRQTGGSTLPRMSVMAASPMFPRAIFPPLSMARGLPTLPGAVPRGLVPYAQRTQPGPWNIHVQGFNPFLPGK